MRLETVRKLPVSFNLAHGNVWTTRMFHARGPTNATFRSICDERRVAAGPQERMTMQTAMPLTLHGGQRNIGLHDIVA